MTGGRTRILLKHVRVSSSDESSLRRRLTRTVEAMCRTRYRNLPFVLRATSTPSPRSVDSLRPWDRISTRVVAATVEAVFVQGGRPRQSARAREIEPGRAYAYPTPFALSPAFTPMRSVFGRPGIGRPRVFSSRRMTVRRETVSPSQHPQRRPSLLRPSFCAPHFCAPHFCAPHFCASLQRHSLQHPSCGTRRRFSAARRGFLRRPSLATRRPRSRVPRFAPTIARRRETVRTIDESSPPRAREIRERRRGSSSCGVVDWRDPSGAFEAREEPRPAFFFSRAADLTAARS